MQTHRTAPALLEVPSSGVLFLPGYGASIRVDAGMLHVRAVIDGRLREQRFPKVGRPKLSRLVVLGKGGMVSLDALAWVAGVGAVFLHLSSDGKILASSGDRGVDLPALRRAQAQAVDAPVGLEVARYLIGQKVGGQSRVVRTSGSPFAEGAAEAIEDEWNTIERAATVPEIVLAEAQAAAGFWSALAVIPFRFGKADGGKASSHWQLVGPRASALTGHPRTATSPAHAIWNYCYRLLDAEARLACQGVGLDPGIGIVHADQRSRDNLALDLMEAARPEVDAFVLKLIADRTFARRDFVELPNGNARLAPSLARMLAGTLPTWRRAVGPYAERVARMLAGSARRSTPTPTRLTGENRSRGRDGIRVGPRRAPAFPAASIPAACRSCGLILKDRDRLLCDECLIEHDRAKLGTMMESGPAALARMRAQGRDPSTTPEAQAKRSGSMSRRGLDVAAWDREHDERPDPEIFRREILPGLQGIPLARIVVRTGLSLRYASLIRRGERVPHPMHWEELERLAKSQRG